MLEIRPAGQADLEAITAIQDACPTASHWPPQDYLAYSLLIALLNGRPVGFLCTREVAGEAEVLNLAVAPHARRQGVARALFARFATTFRGTVFLEVRESNSDARALYNSLGFKVLTLRKLYYDNPIETAIVLTFHSC